MSGFAPITSMANRLGSGGPISSLTGQHIGNFYSMGPIGSYGASGLPTGVTYEPSPNNPLPYHFAGGGWSATPTPYTGPGTLKGDVINMGDSGKLPTQRSLLPGQQLQTWSGQTPQNMNGIIPGVTYVPNSLVTQLPGKDPTSIPLTQAPVDSSTFTPLTPLSGIQSMGMAGQFNPATAGGMQNTFGTGGVGKVDPNAMLGGGSFGMGQLGSLYGLNHRTPYGF